MRSAILLLAAATACLGADLADRIPAIIGAVPAAKQSFWGIRVVDAQSGQLLYSLNDDRFFIPASNTKLFTTSLALRRLGPDYKFKTRVSAPERPDGEGRVAELRLIGGGDPAPRLIELRAARVLQNPQCTDYSEVCFLSLTGHCQYAQGRDWPSPKAPPAAAILPSTNGLSAGTLLYPL